MEVQGYHGLYIVMQLIGSDTTEGNISFFWGGYVCIFANLGYDVYGREVEQWPLNHKIPGSIPWSSCQLGDFSPHVWREHWFRSQEAESTD